MEKMSKRSTEDCISYLPDSLLHYILSFLDMEDVVRTSVLSKRWQYIWTLVPSLSFVCTEVDDDEVSKFVTWVNTVLLHFQRMSIEKFRIYSTNCSFSSEIDSWAQFAINKNVGDLSLDFNELDGDYYVLPQTVRCSSSLTNLSLRGCALWDGRGISWPSLKSLSLEYVFLDGDVVKDVLCGCPMLEFLEIIDCWGTKSLDIESETLREVVIASEEFSQISLVKILAPNLQFLHFYGHFICVEVKLGNASSLLRATLNFLHPVFWDDHDDTFMGFFNSICHVKELELGKDFIQCISRAMFLLEARALTSQFSRLTSLELSLSNGKIEGPGIIALLKCSPNLETLVVYSSDGKDPCPDFTKQAEEYWKLNRRIENFPLPHLKTVNFLGFMDQEHVGKYILKLVKFVLKNAGHLGSITINGGRYQMIVKPRVA